MKDIDSDEMNRRLWLYEKIREVVRRYGFQMVEPTTIENLKTLEAKSGPSIRNEIYWFKDKAGRSLGLRFDLTVGLARIVANRSDLPEPIKFAAIGGNWRYDEPQFARYRYFTQWDIEIFGSSSPLADAEVICVGADILGNVGLKDFIIRISNRKLTEAYFTQLGISSGKKLEQSLRIIDKTRKESRQQLEKEFRALRINDKIIEEIFSFISLNDSPATVLDKLASFDFQSENAKKGLEELQILANALGSFGRLENCLYDLSIVAELDIMMELFSKPSTRAVKMWDSIFGGGRYDKLCRIYGKRDLPATGVAGGVERLMISLERAGLFPMTRQGAKVFIATVQESMKGEAIQLAQKLRSNGIAADIDLKGRPFGKQLEYADSARIPYLIVLGPQELQSRALKIKEMASRKEIETPFDSIVEKLQSL